MTFLLPTAPKLPLDPPVRAMVSKFIATEKGNCQTRTTHLVIHFEVLLEGSQDK